MSLTNNVHSGCWACVHWRDSLQSIFRSQRVNRAAVSDNDLPWPAELNSSRPADLPSPRHRDTPDATWPQTLRPAEEVALLRFVMDLKKNDCKLCKQRARSSTIVMFSSLRGEGGLTTKQSGGRNRHSRGLVATSFMRRSGAVNPSVIEFIWVNIFTTHCTLVFSSRMKNPR